MKKTGDLTGDLNIHFYVTALVLCFVYLPYPDSRTTKRLDYSAEAGQFLTQSPRSGTSSSSGAKSVSEANGKVAPPASNAKKNGKRRPFQLQGAASLNFINWRNLHPKIEVH